MIVCRNGADETIRKIEEIGGKAYYVKCDSELNNDLAIANGQVVAEIGYAKQKPAEFVIVKIVQKSAE